MKTFLLQRLFEVISGLFYGGTTAVLVVLTTKDKKLALTAAVIVTVLYMGLHHF